MVDLKVLALNKRSLIECSVEQGDYIKSNVDKVIEMLRIKNILVSDDTEFSMVTFEY